MTTVCVSLPPEVVEKFAYLRSALSKVWATQPDCRLSSRVGSAALPFAEGEQLYALVPQLGLEVAIFGGLLVSVLVFGGVIFLCEQTVADNGSVWWRLVLSFWLAFTSLTSIGYGDIFPRSPLARTVSLSAALTGLFFPIVVAWLTGKRRVKLDDFGEEEVVLSTRTASSVEFAAGRWPSKSEMRKRLVQEVGKRLLLGNRHFCVAGTKGELLRLRRALGMSAFLKVTPLEGAVTTHHLGEGDSCRSAFARSGSGPFSSTRLARESLFLVQRRGNVWTWKFALAALLATTVLFAVGGLGYFLLEVGRNPTIPESPVAGIAQGAYLSAISVLTVGFGDVSPVTVPGKLWTVVNWAAFQHYLPYVLRFARSLRVRPQYGEIVHNLLSGHVAASLTELRTLEGSSDRVLIPGAELQEALSHMGWLERLRYSVVFVEGVVLAADYYHTVPLQEDV